MSARLSNPTYTFHAALNTLSENLHQQTSSCLTPTHSLSKAVKPSKIPAGKVVRSLLHRSLPGSRTQQRAEHTRRAASWASDSAAGHGHRQRHDRPAHVHRRRPQTPSSMVRRPGHASTIVKGDTGRPGNTLGKHQALEFPFQPTRATRPSTLRPKTYTNNTSSYLSTTHRYIETVKPSKIPAGKVVRAFSFRYLSGSKIQQRAEHTRRAVSRASDSAAGHGHRQGMTGPLMCTDDVRKRLRRWCQHHDTKAH